MARKSIQRNTDGTLARYYTKCGWHNLVQELFNVEYTTIKGPKSDLILLPGGKFKDIVMNAVPNAVTRFLTNRCGMGGFLVSKLVRK